MLGVASPNRSLLIVFRIIPLEKREIRSYFWFSKFFFPSSRGKKRRKKLARNIDARCNSSITRFFLPRLSFTLSHGLSLSLSLLSYFCPDRSLTITLQNVLSRRRSVLSGLYVTRSLSLSSLSRGPWFRRAPRGSPFHSCLSLSPTLHTGATQGQHPPPTGSLSTSLLSMETENIDSKYLTRPFFRR